MKRSSLLFVGAVLIALFQNCAQNVNFKTEDAIGLSSSSGDASAVSPDSTSSNDNNAEPSAPAVSERESAEQFKVVFNSEAAPLDMIWVIDNSGSMNEEAALVRKNFDAFLTALNKTTNFRLLLVTQQGTSGTAVSIPSSFDPLTHKQINQRVESNDGPQLLLNNLKSLPAGFLRADSKKIVVFVTDDNSALASASFMSSLIAQQKWSAKDVSVSSFIGIDKATSPCMYRAGAIYKELATQTGGRNYNICMQDWSANFSDLINVSVSKAVRRFTLAVDSVKSVVEVKVDGVVLDKSAYSISGKALTLADGVSLAENSIVSIVYKY